MNKKIIFLFIAQIFITQSLWGNNSAALTNFFRSDVANRFISRLLSNYYTPYQIAGFSPQEKKGLLLSVTFEQEGDTLTEKILSLSGGITTAGGLILPFEERREVWDFFSSSSDIISFPEEFFWEKMTGRYQVINTDNGRENFELIFGEGNLVFADMGGDQFWEGVGRLTVGPVIIENGVTVERKVMIIELSRVIKGSGGVSVRLQMGLKIVMQGLTVMDLVDRFEAPMIRMFTIPGGPLVQDTDWSKTGHFVKIKD